MGLDFNTAKFLLWGKNLGVSFERTLTLGHQGFYVPPAKFRRKVKQFGMAATPEQIARCFEHPPMTSPFADNFLRFLGAREVVSVDRSDFEAATLLHDLNEPFPEKWHGQMDFVFDGGTLEHIFNYPVALANCLELLRVRRPFCHLHARVGPDGARFLSIQPGTFFPGLQ